MRLLLGVRDCEGWLWYAVESMIWQDIVGKPDVRVRCLEAMRKIMEWGN